MRLPSAFKVCDHLVPQVELLESLKCNTQPFYGLFPEPLGKPVPEEIFTLWCKGR